MRSWLRRLGVTCVLASAAVWALARGGPAGDQEWSCFGNDPGAMRFSPLAQIRRANVRALRVAWVYHTGDADGECSEEGR